MSDYPVHYHVKRSERLTRLQLAVRVVAFMAIGMLGLSFGMIFAFLYLGLPAYAASRLAKDEAGYLDGDGKQVEKVLGWFAAITAWAGLTAEHLPGSGPEEQVELVIDAQGDFRPTANGAIWRVLKGIPSALVLGILSWVGIVMWVWAAVSILLAERVRKTPFEFLQGLQRWSVRLLAYQASLVEDYPPFSFGDARPTLPSARVVVREDISA